MKLTSQKNYDKEPYPQKNNKKKSMNIIKPNVEF